MLKTYSGLLRYDWHCEADDIVYLSTLEEPLAEELLWMNGRQVTVRYWVTDRECSRDEAVEASVMTALGAAEVEFQSHYSDYTGYLWTDEGLNVGGHDLMAELRSNVGKWLILEVTDHTPEQP
jgi:hypothetical protein